VKPIRPDLVIKRQTLDFSQRPQTDAEGQVARRRFHTEVAAGPGQAGVVNAQGMIPGIIEYNTTAGELAEASRSPCAGCQHHDVKAWRQFVAAATGPASTAEDRDTIQKLRGRLMVDGVGVFNDDGEFDVEATLMSFGICRPLTDWVEGVVGKNPMHWPIVTSREANCPSYVAAGGARMEVTYPSQPLGLFKPRDLDSKKYGAARYDAVLFDAAGKSR